MREIKNLSNTKWQLFDNIGVIGTGTNIFYINFYSKAVWYSSIKFEDIGKTGKLYFDNTLVCSYPESGWIDEDYQTIEIDGGKDVTNASLITWLKNYGQNVTTNTNTNDLVKVIYDIADAIEAGGGGGGTPEGTSIKSTGVPAGKVLSADGEGGASWEDGGSGESPIMKVDITLTPVTHTETITMEGEEQEITVFDRYQTQYSKTPEEMNEWAHDGGIIAYRLINEVGQDSAYLLSNYYQNMLVDSAQSSLLFINSYSCLCFEYLALDPTLLSQEYKYLRAQLPGMIDTVYVKVDVIAQVAAEIGNFGQQKLKIADEISGELCNVKVIGSNYGDNILFYPESNKGWVYYLKTINDYGEYKFYSWEAPYMLMADFDEKISDTKMSIYFWDYNDESLPDLDFMSDFGVQDWKVNVGPILPLVTDTALMQESYYFTSIIPNPTGSTGSDEVRAMVYYDSDASSWVFEIADIGGGGSSDSNVEWLQLPIYNYNYDESTQQYSLDDSVLLTTFYIPIDSTNSQHCPYSTWEDLIENTQDINVNFDIETQDGEKIISYDGPSAYLTKNIPELSYKLGLGFLTASDSPPENFYDAPIDILIQMLQSPMTKVLGQFVMVAYQEQG